MTFQDRFDALRADLSAALLVTKPANLLYLTGYAGTNGYLVVDGERALFVTDGRYAELAEELMTAIPGGDVLVYSTGLAATLASVIEGPTTLEADHVTWSFATSLAEEADQEIVAGGGAVERLRRTKDSTEVSALQAAAAAGDAALAALAGLEAAATTERELAWGLVTEMKANGGDIADWDPIVAVGANAARPHHETNETELTDGLLLLDYGCVVDGYHSDMTRTLWRGPADGIGLMRAINLLPPDALKAVGLAMWGSA